MQSCRGFPEFKYVVINVNAVRYTTLYFFQNGWIISPNCNPIGPKSRTRFSYLDSKRWAIGLANCKGTLQTWLFKVLSFTYLYNEISLKYRKMWFKNGDVQVHQLRYHLAYTHLVLEPFAIAMYRCLPPVHPVFKLLREHLHYVIAINIIGRQTLLCKVSLYLLQINPSECSSNT